MSPAPTQSPTSKPITQKSIVPTSKAPSNQKIFSAGSIDGLLTNEFAFYNKSDPGAVVSMDWDMTSGSLFSKSGAFWTGVPDTCDTPNAKSRNCTNSDVFRANSKQIFGGTTNVSLSILQLSDPHNSGCNNDDTCWHGTHIWLRYQNQFNLYYASINRADGQMVIKRKVPCGNDNSGTYFVLGTYVKHNYKAGNWNKYTARIQNNSDNSVTILIFDPSVSTTKPVVQGVDKGGTNPNWSTTCNVAGKYPTAQYSPISAAGSIGVRGDYANFEFKDLTVN